MQDKDPIKQILIDTRALWDHADYRPTVRENFTKIIDCKTAALGWQLYASDTETRRVYCTCKSRMCPSCGYRATLAWQREQWAQLPDVPYAGVVFTMPDVLWPIFKRNRHLLHDLPTIGAQAVSQWMKDKHGVHSLILVVQHTFGRHLDFKPHLHLLLSAGGLSETEARWVRGLSLNPVAFMKIWRYGVITYLRRALQAGILKSDLRSWELKEVLRIQYERPWHVNLKHRIPKKHFLGYAARYLRRPPIAKRRFEEVDGEVIKFWTKDTKTNETVLDALAKTEFVERLADHTPEKYQHAVRYYGLLAPRSRNRAFSFILALLGKKRRPRPRPLSWAQSIMQCFAKNPLIDSRGHLMQYVSRYCPVIA
jgi:putative transposase/transposase-like zinc-binding protein